MQAAICTHLDQVGPVVPLSRGCEDCLKIGDTWIHLRLYMECKSFEPGEDWGWRYIDEVELAFAPGS
jgi:monovalent cation:H+ antiporter-2, CPA2 family